MSSLKELIFPTLNTPSQPIVQPNHQPWNGLRARELFLTIHLLATEIRARERLLDAELVNLAENPPPDGEYDHELLTEFKILIEEARESLEEMVEGLEDLQDEWNLMELERPGYLREATRARCVPVLERGMERFIREGVGMVSSGNERDLDLWTANARRALDGGAPEATSAGLPSPESSDGETTPRGNGNAPAQRDPTPSATTDAGPVVRDFASPSQSTTPAPDDIFEEYLGDIAHRTPKREEVVDLSGAFVSGDDTEISRAPEDSKDDGKTPGLRDRKSFAARAGDD